MLIRIKLSAVERVYIFAAEQSEVYCKEDKPMSNLAKHIHDDKNGPDYTLHGDYYLPDLGVEPGYP